MPSGSCNVSECEFPKEVDIIYGRGTGRLHAPSMARIGCREHRVRSSLFPDHFLREYQHSPTNSFQKAFCPFRESCFLKTCNKSVAPVAYKNKLTVNRRRHLAGVLWPLTCRCALFPSESDVSVSYMQPGLRGMKQFTNFPFTALRGSTPVPGLQAAGSLSYFSYW